MLLITLNNSDQEYPTYPTMRENNLRVLHITDLHFDPEYAPGSEANCSSELCCHKQSELNGNFYINTKFVVKFSSNFASNI